MSGAPAVKMALSARFVATVVASPSSNADRHSPSWTCGARDWPTPSPMPDSALMNVGLTPLAAFSARDMIPARNGAATNSPAFIPT
jgi:hypothetical protein